jgi:hypothetical protein
VTDDSIQHTPDTELPTEFGWYLGSRNVVFCLNAKGWWSPNIRPRPEPEDVKFWSPLTRLYTLPEAAAVISGRFLGSDLVFDSDHDNAIVAARLLEIAEEA